MRIRILASVLLTGFLVLQAAQAVAQTPTFTRRPTPEPTATHTETPPAGTPTPPPGGTSVFLCSGGPNDGAQCNDFSDCPNGACVLSQGVCDGGDNDGGYCASPDDCPTGQCVAAQRVCLSGDDKGNSCLRDDQCDGQDTGDQCEVEHGLGLPL